MRSAGHGGAIRTERPELSTDAFAGERVPEGLRSDPDQVCAPTQQVVGVTAALYPTHAHDGQPDPRADLRDLREGDRPDRRTGHAAGPAAEPRLASPVRMRREASQRVDQRDGVGAVLLGGPGDVRR